MAKLEGTSPLSKAPNHLIEYHIGGFRAGQNTMRQVSLNLPVALVVDNNNEGPSTITIKADINKWFDGHLPVRIVDQQACTTPGEGAVKYARNPATVNETISTSNMVIFICMSVRHRSLQIPALKIV